MTNEEMAALTASIVNSVKAYVDRAIGAAEERAIARETVEFDERKAAILGFMAALPKPKDGEPGPAGKDAAPVDVSALLDELRSAIDGKFASIPVPKDGIDGKDADPQAIAEALKPTIKSFVEEAVALIPPPVNGMDGQDGQDGADGKQGEPGRDAAQIDIVTAFDEAKCYSRGTWAQFGGGLWRAARPTQPIAEAKSAIDAGWDCMVAGVQAVSCDVDATERQLKLVIVAGGHEYRLNAPVPMMIFRGAYGMNKEYMQGDVVTSDGSGWVADCKTSGIPGASPDWKLIAKKGRDFRPMDRSAQRDEPIRLR